jgi:hypothetical protein
MGLARRVLFEQKKTISPIYGALLCSPPQPGGLQKQIILTQTAELVSKQGVAPLVSFLELLAPKGSSSLL